MESTPPRPDEEGFGEASLGEAQSSDPPADRDMIRDDAGDADQTPEEFARDVESDPAHNPSDDELGELKGG